VREVTGITQKLMDLCWQESDAKPQQVGLDQAIITGNMLRLAELLSVLVVQINDVDEKREILQKAIDMEDALRRFFRNESSLPDMAIEEHHQTVMWAVRQFLTVLKVSYTRLLES